MPNTKNERERKLDQSLRDTFPASDPNSQNEVDHKPVRPIDRKPAHIDRDNVKKLADEVAKKLGRKEDLTGGR